jgi:peptide methionine sulfoxide reductase MsrA
MTLLLDTPMTHYCFSFRNLALHDTLCSPPSSSIIVNACLGTIVFSSVGALSLSFTAINRKKMTIISTRAQRMLFLSIGVIASILLASSNAFSTKASSSSKAPGLMMMMAKDNMAELNSSRRQVFQNILLGATAAATTLATAVPRAVAADDDDKLIEVYFGCGCFWHVHHEFVEAERRILGRSDDQLTARAGYAGGRGGMQDGKVCYHNAAKISDYGSLGHAEVVKLDIPESSLKDFAREYFLLFSKEGYRPDQFGDVGLEYRNLVGLPGGVTSPYAQVLVEASKAEGDKLDFAKGKGDDPDRRALAFVMDTTEYPFYVAEQYHQFHDGFNLGENYPSSYNNLASKLSKAQTLGVSECPNGLLGIGAFGM